MIFPSTATVDVMPFSLSITLVLLMRMHAYVHACVLVSSTGRYRALSRITNLVSSPLRSGPIPYITDYLLGVYCSYSHCIATQRQIMVPPAIIARAPCDRRSVSVSVGDKGGDCHVCPMTTDYCLRQQYPYCSRLATALCCDFSFIPLISRYCQSVKDSAKP